MIMRVGGGYSEGLKGGLGKGKSVEYGRSLKVGALVKSGSVFLLYHGCIHGVGPPVVI